MEESDKYPFCQDIMSSSSARTSCTFDATAIGSCNLVQFGSTLPPLYQNFDAIEGIDLVCKILPMALRQSSAVIFSIAFLVAS